VKREARVQCRRYRFSDDELSDLMRLADAVPVEHRAAFLEAVADALGDNAALGPGIVHRTAAALQRRFITAPPMQHAKGHTSKYR
jgi:hypothetical protein